MSNADLTLFFGFHLLTTRHDECRSVVGGSLRVESFQEGRGEDRQAGPCVYDGVYFKSHASNALNNQWTYGYFSDSRCFFLIIGGTRVWVAGFDSSS